MGREQDDEPERAEAEGAEAEGAEAEPAGDSAGVYYLSIEDFEARSPRSGREEAPPEEP